MSAKTIKHAWGHSQVVFQSPREILTKASGPAGGRSSLHVHRTQMHVLTVLSGIVVVERRNARPLVAHADQSVVVGAGVFHRLHLATPAQFYELYLPTVNTSHVSLDDIDRIVPGQSADTNRMPILRVIGVEPAAADCV